MGNIMKINLYVENKGKKKNKFNLQIIEKVIKDYNGWLKQTNREDKIENYAEFIQAK